MHTKATVMDFEAGRRRRKHSDEFKAQAVRACEHPGVSMAAVALAYGINANLLRRWVLSRRTVAANAALPSFIPLRLPAAALPLSSSPPPLPSGDIQIEIQREAMSVKVVWPASVAEGCAAWLHKLLQHPPGHGST